KPASRTEKRCPGPAASRGPALFLWFMPRAPRTQPGPGPPTRITSLCNESGLRSHPCRGGRRRSRIAQIGAPDRLEVVAELVHKRDARRDVALDDVRIGNVAAVLSNRAKA